jgi:predicted DNA-binding transcriptional regulator AlpA
MDVITIECEAYKKLLSKLEKIEEHIKRTSNLFSEIDDTLEMTTREVIETLGTSESTIYRWRNDKLVPFRYNESGRVRFLYKDLYLAIKCSRIYVHSTNKKDLLIKMAEFKDDFVRNNFLESLDKDD